MNYCKVPLHIESREELLSQLDHKLRAACERDPKWNQLVDERDRLAEEYNSLAEEVEKLMKMNIESKEDVLEIRVLELREHIIYSMAYAADWQQLQRISELEKSQLEDDLKAATSYPERERIQQRQKRVDGELRDNKRKVRSWEKEAYTSRMILKEVESIIKEEATGTTEKDDMSEYLPIWHRQDVVPLWNDNLWEVLEEDPKWKQFIDEYNHQAKEHNRLLEEIKNLKNMNIKSIDYKQVKILEQRKEVAYSKAGMVKFQRLQKESELEKFLLEDDLKTATSHQERERIQKRLCEVEGNLQNNKRSAHTWNERVNRTAKELKQLDSTMKEEESQRLLDEALKQGYLLMRFMICLMVGPPGVGKTCLKHLLLGKHPPHPCERCSTICAENPVKIRSMSSSKVQMMLGKWREVIPEQLLPSIGRFIRRNAKKHGVIIPIELKEYLEQLEASTSTSISENLAPNLAGAGSSDALTVVNSTLQSSGEGHTPLQSSGGSQPFTSLDEAAALKVTIDSVFATLEKVIAGKELSEEEVEELFSSDWVYLTDCGGQPQFHELLPLFIQEITSLIVVSRLSDRLDDCPPDEYYQQGELVGKKSATHLTTAEQVKCLIRSLMSRAIEGSCPDIIMVGTHRDKASKCSESIEQKNEKLLEMFGPELEEHLVFYEGVKGLLFPLNTLCPEEQDKEVARSIQAGVEKSELVKEVKVPIWWFILELLIQGLAKKLGKRVLRRELCVHIAHALGFTERAFEAALKFFDKLNVIKYFPALPEVVFVDSQVPLDNVSDLVEEGYLLRHGRPSSRRGNWKHFCYEGVVTLGFMDSTCKHFEKGVFESAELLELLKDQLVVVPLEPLSHINHIPETDEYFMPALLDILSQEELEKHRVFCSAAAPLLFRFSHGCRRAGVFCCLIVYLMKESKWSIQHRNKKLILVSRNCISFRITNDNHRSCIVTLIDAFYFFEVHIAKDTPLFLCCEMCPTIQREILAGIRAACKKLRYINDQPQLAMFCPSCDCTIKETPSPSSSDGRHAAVLEKSGCECIEKSHHAPISNRHTIWLAEETQGESASSGVPSTKSNEASNTGLILTGGNQLGDDSTMHYPSSSAMPASQLPHIPEYLSISSSGATEDMSDNTKPSSSNLTVIKWKNDRGEVKKFKLKNSIIHKWRDIGNLVVLRQQLEVWAKKKDDKECCEAVLSYWLDHPPRHYPATWDGLYELLDDSELGQIAIELKRAVDNAI